MNPTPDDPGDGPDLPEELRHLLEQFGGPGIIEQIRAAVGSTSGPVNWQIARQVALQVAADGDRPPTPEQTTRAEEAQAIAEHWLDEGALPAPPDAGRLAVVSRQAWVHAALEGLRGVIEPVAAASIGALEKLATDQADDALGMLPPELDLGASIGPLLRPMGAVLMGLQSGQVIGQLAQQLIGQYDLGLPTAEPSVAYRIPVNAGGVFDGYDLDPVELEVVLALHEGAHRRQYHAVPWLTRHVHSLIAQFAEGTTIDADRLLDVSRDLMTDVDPDDPESLQAAMEQAAQFRLEPTPGQRRVLERLQGVILLLQAWVRQEVRGAAEDRLPNLVRVEEVLRRRRATHGSGEEMLAGLLGLDLKPDDEEVGDHFLEAVREARGLEGLRRALAHPENLPDAEELAEPSRWLVRMAGGEDIPDDPSELFGAGEAPVEPPANERGDENRDDAGGEV
jgi:putative hydrolase